MSVLIKGMEMPKSCGDCNFYYVDYEEGTANCLATSCYVQPHHYHKDNRDPDCPLVEVPTPHGGLIDEETKVESYIETWTCTCSDFGTQRVMAVDDLRCLPEIIEAEVSEE